jgi:hypothetical protein
MSASDATFKIVENFDRLPADAIVSAKVARQVLGDTVSERTLRRAPPVPRRQISERKFGFRVGDLRALIRGEKQPASTSVTA